jgi:tetratricopeptide (TPR) repeat protein
LDRFDEAHRVLTEACSLANGLGAKPQLWPILASLATVNSKLGKYKEAEAILEEARTIIQQTAESLREVGLSESFLNQPRVQKLMR